MNIFIIHSSSPEDEYVNAGNQLNICLFIDNKLVTILICSNDMVYELINK